MMLSILSVEYPGFYFVEGEEGLEMALQGIKEKVNCIHDYVKKNTDFRRGTVVVLPSVSL